MFHSNLLPKFSMDSARCFSYQRPGTFWVNFSSCNFFPCYTNSTRSNPKPKWGTNPHWHVFGGNIMLWSIAFLSLLYWGGIVFQEPSVQRSQVCAEDLCSSPQSQFSIPRLHMVVNAQALGWERLTISFHWQPRCHMTCLSLKFSIPSLFLTHEDVLLSFQDQIFIKRLFSLFYIVLLTVCTVRNCIYSTVY